MLPEDEDFLTQLHRNLELRDLHPDDDRYVDLEKYSGAVGPDAVKYLGRTVARTTDGTLFFLSGLRGSGKTTQLRRLREDLARRGYAALRIDAEQYLNLRRPVDVVEFLFFLVGGLSDELEKTGWLPQGVATARAWERLRSWLADLPGRLTITPEAEFSAGIDIPGIVRSEVSLKAEIRSDESFVAQLRRFLDGRLSELANEANLIVHELVQDLRSAWGQQSRGDWMGLVLLVDSLDHVRGAEFAVIRQALVDLFDKQTRTITLRDCRTVFIVPPYLQIDYGIVRHLTNVKVADRARQPYPEGVGALREVLERRVPQGSLGRLFQNEEAVLQVISASGGNLRDLLRLVTEIETQAERLPVDHRTITSSIQQVTNGMLPLSLEEIELLRVVAASHRAPLRSQANWEELAQLYDRHLLLGYTNGETWYDVHPLVYEEVAGAK